MESMTGTPEEERYAKAIVSTMRDVLPETFGDHHPTLLECFAFGLDVGLAVGLDFPDQARRLLAIAVPEEKAGIELAQDAQDFLGEALG